MKPREMKKKKKKNRTEKMKKKIKIKKTQKFRNYNITCAESRASRYAEQSRAAAVQGAPQQLCRERRCAEGALVHSERLTDAAEARESEASLRA